MYRVFTQPWPDEVTGLQLILLMVGCTVVGYWLRMSDEWRRRRRVPPVNTYIPPQVHSEVILRRVEVPPYRQIGGG